MKIFLVALLAAVSLTISPSAEAAPSSSFRNCAAMRNIYPLGVARNQKSAGAMKIFVSREIYRANRRLDVDKDGLACEDEAEQLRRTITTTPTAPAAPDGLTLTLNTPFDGTGYLSWIDRSDNEDNFYVSDVDPSRLSDVSLASLWYKAARNQTRVNVTGLLNGRTYCLWVMATNVVGNSAWSSPACTLAGAATTTTTMTTTTTTTTRYVTPTTQYVPPAGRWSGSSSNWLGCYYKGRKMWGKAYVTPYSFDADIKVYQTPYSFDAALKVYNSPYAFDATSCGRWYITNYSFDADFKVYFSPYSFDADFKIYITPYSFDAGR